MGSGKDGPGYTTRQSGVSESPQGASEAMPDFCTLHPHQLFCECLVGFSEGSALVPPQCFVLPRTAISCNLLGEHCQHSESHCATGTSAQSMRDWAHDMCSRFRIKRHFFESLL